MAAGGDCSSPAGGGRWWQVCSSELAIQAMKFCVWAAVSAPGSRAKHAPAPRPPTHRSAPESAFLSRGLSCWCWRARTSTQTRCGGAGDSLHGVGSGVGGAGPACGDVEARMEPPPCGCRPQCAGRRPPPCLSVPPAAAWGADERPRGSWPRCPLREVRIGTALPELGSHRRGNVAVPAGAGIDQGVLTSACSSAEGAGARPAAAPACAGAARADVPLPCPPLSALQRRCRRLADLVSAAAAGSRGMDVGRRGRGAAAVAAACRRR